MNIKIKNNHSYYIIFDIDKENNIFYLKEVKMLENSKNVSLSLDIGDRIFRNFEEINKEFYIC